VAVVEAVGAPQGQPDYKLKSKRSQLLAENPVFESASRISPLKH